MTFRIQPTGEPDVVGIVVATNLAMSRAVNRVARSGRTAASKAIRQKYMVTKDWLDKKMRIRNATPAKLNATLRIRHERPVAAHFFAPQQTAAGVSIQLERGNRTILKGAFKAYQQRGSMSVAKRTGPERFPIKTQRTLTVPDMFLSTDCFRVLDKVIEEKLQTEFNRQFSNLVRTGRGR